jgi:hypothetical protein
MSDTPETDEQFKSFPAYFEIDLFCRKLERERDEAREELATLCREKCREQRERDEAQEIAHDLAVIASHCLGSHSFSLSETSERIAYTLKRWRSTQPCKK